MVDVEQLNSLRIYEKHFESDFPFPSYDNAKAYTYYTYISKVLDGTPHPNNMTKVKLNFLQNERTSNNTENFNDQENILIA